MQYPEPASTHFIIGLTGTIGSGKSLVRKMLEHLGALSIDADWLTRQASAPGAPAAASILARFGGDILNENGAINRQRLAQIVFNDPASLQSLESILHPLVSQAGAVIIRRSPRPVVVLEAIKLLESDLVGQCQSIWVVDTDSAAVYPRLEASRGMARAEVELRLARQMPPAEMLRRADVVIRNSGNQQETWRQVQSAWAALKKPDRVMPTFQKLAAELNLLLPGPESVRRLQAMLRRNPDSLLVDFLVKQVRKNHTQTSGRSRLDDADGLFQDLVRFYFSAPDEDSLAVWDIDHFNCHLAAYILPPQNREQYLSHLLKGMEDFALHYLCRQFSLPALTEDQTALNKLGYDLQTDPGSGPEVSLKAGYNLYRKTYPSGFKLFES